MSIAAARPRPCPACGSQSTEPIYTQQFESFRQGSIGDGYDVVACAGCGMCFASGLPEPERFAQYYADSSKYDLTAEGAQLSALEVERYANQAGFVAAHVGDRGSPVLDVGTATGGFLVALRDAGFERPYGVEPSPDAVRVARQDFGLEVAVGGLNEAHGWGTSSDSSHTSRSSSMSWSRANRFARSAGSCNLAGTSS